MRENTPVAKKPFTNKLNLNKFHQIKRRSDQAPNPHQVLKKKIHDLKRQIDHGITDQTLLEQKQIKLNELQKDLGKQNGEQKKKEKQEKYFERKYKPIKNIGMLVIESFRIELKKLSRKLKSVQTQLQDSTVDKQELLTQKQDILVKIAYVKRFPKDQKYISIFNENTEIGLKKKTHLLANITEKNERVAIKKYEYNPSNEPKQIKEQKDDDFFTEEQVVEPSRKKFVNKLGKLVE